MAEDDGASAEVMGKIRLTLLAALQETERIEEAFQGLSRESGPVNDRLVSLVKLLATLDEHASVLDPDYLTVPSEILTSLAQQSNESVQILTSVKRRIDVSAAKAKAQIAPIDDLREKVSGFLSMTDAELENQYRESLTKRGLMPPVFLEPRIF